MDNFWAFFAHPFASISITREERKIPYRKLSK